MSPSTSNDDSSRGREAWSGRSHSPTVLASSDRGGSMCSGASGGASSGSAGSVSGPAVSSCCCSSSFVSSWSCKFCASSARSSGAPSSECGGGASPSSSAAGAGAGPAATRRCSVVLGALLFDAASSGHVGVCLFTQHHSFFGVDHFESHCSKSSKQSYGFEVGCGHPLRVNWQHHCFFSIDQPFSQLFRPAKQSNGAEGSVRLQPMSNMSQQNSFFAFDQSVCHLSKSL
mmetsp:Transcript_89591/g.253553  ORF Transcript_89591/g.253553 Transcript_89591/m.253553 type:complete len:230 (-) Transcript_89591:1461-2150(-)